MSIVLSWVLWVVLVNYQYEWLVGSYTFVASRSKVWMAWGPENVQLASEARAVLLPLTRGAYTNSRLLA